MAATAQSSTIDSLKNLLQTEKQDSGRVMLLCDLAREYIYSQPDTALSLVRDAIGLARKTGFKKGEIMGLRGVSSFFTLEGNYPAALSTDLEALRITEETRDLSSMAGICRGIASVYFYQGDVPRSVLYSNRAIALCRKTGDSEELQKVYSDLGDTYEKSNQLDSALLYTRLGYMLCRHLPDSKTAESTSLCNMGNILRKLHQTDSALYYYQAATPGFVRQINYDGLSEVYLGLGDLYMEKNQPDSGLYYARLSYALAHRSGYADREVASSKFLATYYKSQRNIDSAYAYEEAAIAETDSLFSQQKMSEMQSLTYEETMRQQQIDEAKEQERVKARQNTLIGGIAALVVVAFVLVRNNRQRRKANELLQQQKKEIDQKAQELSMQKESLQQSYENVEQLGEIGRKITSSLSVEKIIGTVYHNVNALMDANVFGIGIYNESLNRLEFPSTYENGEALPFYANSLDDRNRFGPLCFNSGQEIIMGNMGLEYKSFIQEVPTPHEGEQPVSVIFLPLVAKEKKLGVLTVQSFKENAYSDYHLFMLRNIATYTSIAIENAESFESLNEALSTLQATQSQLIQSEKMASLGELTAGIAHEIQNPLNFVNNFSEVNREMIAEMREEIDKGNYEEAKSIARNLEDNEAKINHHGKRADSIVKGMLQHSRSSTSQKEPADINALCDEYLRLSYHGLRAKDASFNAEMKTSFETDLDKVNIIAQDVGRVLLNLFTNAFYAVIEKKKTAGPGFRPTVSVETRKVNGRILVLIGDNGSGIPQGIMEKIFQPFFTTKPAGQGTGLGLSISYDIIKAHGGEITVDTRPGEGTRFTISLPAA